MRDLVERAQRGDREAFGALVQLTSDRMYALAARILRDNDLAEDALQGALINAWRQLPALREPDRFEAWLRKVLVHACYAEARRRRSWSANVRVLPVDGPAGPDDLIPSMSATRSIGRSGACRSSSARSSSCITTRVCRWSRSPSRSASRPGRPGLDSTTRRRCCAPPSMRTTGACRERRTDGMSTERDFDRIARAWLDVGPNEAPDRAIATILDAVGTTAQNRRPWRWPFWRPTTMTRFPCWRSSPA